MEGTQIIILAAGKGTRMESDNPKALAVLRGKPFLKHVLDTVSKLDASIPPLIVVGYKKEQVYEVIGNDLKYVEQHEQLGTGHAVLVAKDHAQHDHTTVFVSYVDQPLLTKETIERIVGKQKETDAEIVMGTALVPDFLDWRAAFEKFGRIKRDTTGKLIGIVEYKDATDEERSIKEVNPAYFAFKASWLWDELHKLKNENTQKEYYLTDLVKVAFQEGKRIETVSIEPKEALGANSKGELETLERVFDM